MNTTSATRTSNDRGSLFIQIVRRWYAWAGLAMTAFAAYLALDGQLRIDSLEQLQAAPPGPEPEPEVTWTTHADTANSDKAIAPILPPRMARDAAKPLTAAEPDVIPSPKSGTPVGPVLEGYASGGPVVRTRHEDTPAKDGPAIPVPPPPPVNPPPAPKLELIQPDSAKPKDPAPAERPKNLPPRKLDVAADPAPKPDTTKAPVTTLPQADDKVSVQEGEPIPTMPMFDKSNKALAAEVESLKENERLIYSRAQNAVQLKNFTLASESYELLLRNRPDLIYIRAEYAGILVTAGDLQRAIEQYKRVVELAPTSMAFRIRLGDVYVIARDYRRAIQVFTEALKTPPFEPEYAVRLARAYAYDGDIARATQVYDRYLANIRPDDPRAPAALGALLLDLDRPNEALPYLLEKRKQIERDPQPRENLFVELLASLARGYARIGERKAALDAINEMADKAKQLIAVRQVLGDTLYAIEEYELAGQVYNQMLTLDPMNGQALIGMAKVHLEMQLPANARKILDSFRPAPADVRDYLMAYAVYHQRIGEYMEAKQIYSDMLRRNENDHQVRLSLGLLFDFRKEEWERAKAEFAKIPPYGATGKAARRAFADALVHQRKFKEGLEVDKVLLDEDPTDYLTVGQTTRHFAKAGQYDQAVAVARGFLATNPRSENQANSVRLALARALLEGSKYLDSAREYEIVLSRPTGRVVEAYYGLARACEKLGNVERARQLDACTIGLPGGDLRSKLMVADLASADYNDGRVMEITHSLLAADPTYLPALIRLGDAQQRQSRFSGNPSDVFVTAQAILALSPTNIRGHLAMARSFSVAQNYRKAAGQYDQLIQIDPEFQIPQRERARVLYADHQYSAARTQYEAMQKVGPDQLILVNAQNLIQRDPKLKAILGPYVLAGMNGGNLRKELGQLSLVVPDVDSKLAMQRLIADYDARLAEQTAIRLEQEAKELKDYRAFKAIGALEASIAYEPTNTESLFDLGQQYGTLHWNSKELNLYSETLNVDPSHRDAMVAAERSSAEMAPKLDGVFSWMRQRGRNGLTAIDATRYTVDGRIPMGDENEFAEIGYTRAVFQPPNHAYQNALGNIPFLRVQKRCCDDLLLAYGQINVEDYRNGFNTRPTFDVGAIYHFCDYVWLRGGGYLENVPDNGEAIRQDIFRGGVYLGADIRPTRLWGLGGTWRYAHYSDSNDAHFFDLYNELILTPPPKEFRLVEHLYYMGYRQPTIFPTNPPDQNNLFGTIHPYFAPKSFVQTELRIEWWHWLSRDYMVHTNQCYYSLQYGIMTDNQLVTYHNLRVLFNYDVCTWLTIGAQGDAQLSNVYHMYSAMGFFQIRFK
jgi:tetratricopeptide (TPR) repeat protein